MHQSKLWKASMKEKKKEEKQELSKVGIVMQLELNVSWDIYISVTFRHITLFIIHINDIFSKAPDYEFYYKVSFKSKMLNPYQIPFTK